MTNKSMVKIISISLIIILIICGLPMVFELTSEHATVEALNYSKDTDLSSVNASFIGEYVFDLSGYSVAIAGDVNGDGCDDILIGAPGNDSCGDDAGKVYLLFGKTSGWAMDINLSIADASFMGEDGDDVAGTNVAGAGDVNGDGYDDILIGAPDDEEGASGAGQTYLILGKSTGWTLNTSLANADASFIGEGIDDASGCAVSCAGDVNGDGYDDILIGAAGNGEGGTRAGQVYLIFGNSTGLSLDFDLANADASFLGEDDMDYAGYSAAIVGDVNGDDFDDILIGAYRDEDGGNGAGQAYLILGKATGWANDTSLSNADASFIGEDAWDYAGFSVAGAGDIDRDGYDDMLIGAPYNSETINAAGQVYIILGKQTGWSMDTDLSNADASIRGDFGWTYIGRRVAGAGDVNGDGYDDILIGTYESAGETFLFLGKARNWVMDFSISNANASFEGEDVNDYSATWISGGGDLNRDGYDDIVIGAPGDDDGGDRAGQTYVIFPDTNSKPSSISSVKAYLDDTFSIEISKAKVNDTIYVELQGTDGNASRADITLVNVKSSDSSPRGFNLRLYESGLNTGIYRGSFTIKNRTHDEYHWIKSLNAEIITVTSIQDPSKNAIILVGNLVLYPKIDELVAQEDEQYNVHYSTVNLPNINWLIETNASWLEWNETSHNITGIPDNSEVGNYFVRINISRGPNISDEHNFTLVVKNTPPNITTQDNMAILQNLKYSVDYNSSDDGQGIITWHLATNASWLKIDASSGILNGTPTNADVGTSWVNISVDDGNGGWDSSNFTLTVINVNDAPIITTSNVEITYEDELYEIDYNATDLDSKISNQIWSLDTNATSWLDIETSTGIISGTPTNHEVGSYWVNVSVSDGDTGFAFTNYTLIVLNVNDRPEIITEDEVTAKINILYIVDYNATDIDSPLSQLTWSLITNATWLDIKSSTGILSGIPVTNDAGWFNVNITVDDGDGGQDWHDFILTVTSEGFENTPPEIITIDKVGATAGKSYSVIYEAIDDRTPLESLIWSYNSNASWLSFNKLTRTLSGNPTLNDVGRYWVNITVFDDESKFDSHNFTLRVWSTANEPPDILTEDEINAVVDDLYSVDYEAKDDRTPLDKLEWSLETNTSDWLDINPKTGVLSGIPKFKDVGSYWVKVSVDDGEDGWDFTNFTLYVTIEPLTDFKLELSNPSMTPTTGDTKTEFTFSIDYSHPNGDPPDSIQVVIDGEGHDMISTHGHYEYKTKLSEGNHSYYFTTKLGDFKVDTDTYNTGHIAKNEDQHEDGEGEEDNTMLYALLGIIVIIIVVLIPLFIFLKKKKGKEEEKPMVEEPPAPPPEEVPPEVPPDQVPTSETQPPEQPMAPEVSLEQTPALETPPEQPQVPEDASEQPTPEVTPQVEPQVEEQSVEQPPTPIVEPQAVVEPQPTPMAQVEQAPQPQEPVITEQPKEPQPVPTIKTQPTIEENEN